MNPLITRKRSKKHVSFWVLYEKELNSRLFNVNWKIERYWKQFQFKIKNENCFINKHFRIFKSLYLIISLLMFLFNVLCLQFYWLYYVIILLGYYYLQLLLLMVMIFVMVFVWVFSFLIIYPLFFLFLFCDDINFCL